MSSCISAKAKAAATAIDHFHTLIAKKAPWGLYDASHWSAADATLPEGSKNGKDVISEGTIKHGSGVGHGAKGDVSFIYGSTQSSLYWPEGSIPDSFTICSITRYTGGTNQRIISATAGDWLHGHHQNYMGKAHYNGWKTTNTLGPAQDNTKSWTVLCGSNGLPTPNNILYNGVPAGTASGGSSPGYLAVNPTVADDVNYINPSDWALSFVAIWDQHLGAEEMQTASDALMEYLATGRRILEVPADTPPCSMVSSVTSTTTTTSNGTVTTTSITNIPCPEESA